MEDSNNKDQSPAKAVASLRQALDAGEDWPIAVAKTMAAWTAPTETHRGRHFNYFIGGEAFDWPLLAERLLLDIGGLVPDDERETLLFQGAFPARLGEERFKEMLGVEKYRGALNFHYGVTVEEALQLAVELEVQKRHASNGVRFKEDFGDEAFERLYCLSRKELLQRYRVETATSAKRSIELSDAKAFTYWLFRYRLSESDKARVASDTKKGLDQLKRMKAARAARHVQ